jgi:hypothetical protein
MRHCRWIAIAWIAMGSVAYADELAMKDLAALDAQKAYSELVDRADQVKPSARDASWKKLVVSAATHVVAGIATDSATSLDTASDLIERVPPAERKYPFLREDAGYRAAKAKALESVVALCKHGNRGGCGVLIESLAAGVDKFAKGTAREIAGMVNDDIGPADALHFWALAVADDAAVCKDIWLERAVIATLTAGGERVAEAQKTANTCFASVESGMTEALIDAEDHSTYAKNACPVLKTHGAMTVLKKKKCS